MDICRKAVSQRMSQIVTHGNTIYLAGQVGNPLDSVEDQTREALSRVEKLLAEAGSSPEQILQATIWLADMADFDAMNRVWDRWVPKDAAPARACGESKLASPDLRVEVIVTAAM